MKRRSGQKKKISGKSTDPGSKASRTSAKTKIMDYLARRSHSEKELRQKLSQDYTAFETDAAIAYARESNWIEPPEELTERVCRELDRKGKGELFIQAYLREKGLPAASIDRTKECEKALRVIEKNLNISHPFARQDEPSIIRVLKNRGFEDDVIRKVLKNKF